MHDSKCATVVQLTHEEDGIFKVKRHNSNWQRWGNSHKCVIHVDVANSCILTCEEEINSYSTLTSNWWYSIAVNSSNFKGSSLVSKYTKC